MLKNPDYHIARDLLLDTVSPIGIEQVGLTECTDRILAHDLVASENVPSFDRSPYDGYALCAADTVGASEENPVIFQIIEEIPAGAVPSSRITEKTAAKILTGAPVPEGADAVVMFEKTEFTDKTVKIFAPLKAGENIVCTGEDVKKGQILARKGDKIDPGTAGTMASQGIVAPMVYQIPKVGILCTGSELVEVSEIPESGKIRNSNRHTFEAVLRSMGCEPVYLGMAGDSAEEIAERFKKGLETCDAVISTGGVSVGDYDLTPEAMEAAGVTMLIQGVNMKPGMACAYGVYHGKLVCGLSGNPASSLMNFYAVAMPALKKLMGHREPLPEEISMTLLNGFRKKSHADRFLRGKLVLKTGVAGLEIPKDQGNIVLSSTIGCNAMALVPAGSGPLAEGTVLKGFVL